MANEYSHIPNNHLADALISKIKGVANSKSYAQITSASWSVSEDESSESSESSEGPGSEVDWNLMNCNAAYMNGTTQLNATLSTTQGAPAVAPFHIAWYKDGSLIVEGDAEYSSGQGEGGSTWEQYQSLLSTNALSVDDVVSITVTSEGVEVKTEELTVIQDR
jgi:hypothetical protein